MKKITLNNLDIDVIKETLDNGLDIYLIPNKNVTNYYMTFNTKYGSIDTKFKKTTNKKYVEVPNGIAHFLEHITFKMEDNLDASDMFANLGSYSNAYTSFNQTCYEVKSSDFFKENLNILLDFVQTPAYDEEMIENERGIIISEIKMGEDNPYSELFYRSLSNTLHNSNYKNKISGTVEDVKKITLKDIENCYNTFYHPSNMFVLISGNFNPEEALAIIEENQANKKFDKKFKISRKYEKEIEEVVKEYDEFESDIEIEKVSITLKILKSSFSYLKIPEVELYSYLELITNSKFGATSELQERLVKGNLINDCLYYSVMKTEDAIIISVDADTKYPKRLTTILKKEFQNFNILESDFIRKKKVYLSNLIRVLDKTDLIAYRLEEQIIDYGEIVPNIYDVYNNLDFKTINKISKILPTNKIAVTVLKKKK